MRKRNNQTGNMLILVSVAMTLVALGLLIAASFAGVFFAHNRLQTTADEIALAGARKLNEFNRLGQMNDLIARSRQLVFGVSKEYDQVRTESNNPAMEKFAQQLKDEAVDSAAFLDNERQVLADLAATEAKAEMQKRFDEVKGSYSMVLPWLTVQAPQLVTSGTGKLIGLQSNVQQLQGIDELVGTDKQAGNVFQGSGKLVSVYSIDKDATLPIANSPHFYFSPLAAPIANDISPARTVLPETIESVKGNYAPCATELQLSLKVATGLGPHGEGVFNVRSAAAATGGALFQ
jgi:hypothetical protein